MTASAYLDWNATAPPRPEAAEAMAAALAHVGNPSSVHRAGREAKRMLERARAQVAALIDAPPAYVTFTSGGTEANHLALRGFPERRLIVSAIEHDSVLAAASDAALLPATRDGVADLETLERLLATDERPALVSLMLANNETGVLQPVAEAGQIAHRHGALLHCDAIQALGKISFIFSELNCDLMTLSAHKIGGPMGVGALIASPDLVVRPLQTGGGQERGRRAGTENLPGIVGFGAAATRATSSEYERIAALRDTAERRLLALAPDAHIYGMNAPRLPNTICVAMQGVPAATQVMALDLDGVMVSAGSACSSGKVKRSHVLAAMDVPAVLSECAIRISLGWSTSEAEIDRLVEAWGALYARLRSRAA
ncbi:MAG TPA: cysteine desulfurase family protein [Stellaceae bacterium]|jgi:cysteine desulfurase|nr:cysteine desulfurase family protein [Stellaceae bacterium]